MSDTPETDANKYPADTFCGSGSKTHVVHVDFSKRLERERNKMREALEEIALLDKSQDASPQQCEAVLIAMNALNK